MPDFRLALAFHWGFLVVAIAASVGFSLWIYRQTLPPISKQLRFLLVSLRSASLFLIVLLLGEPLLSLLSRTTERPIVEILIDNSKSMTIHDRRGDRKKTLGDVLRSPSFDRLRSIGEVRYSLFDASFKTLTSLALDSVTANGEGTDIGKALKRVKEATSTSNSQAVILLSDGNSTVGTSPVYEADELGLPIFPVGIGDSSEQKDVMIRRLQTNEITYVGNRVPVTVVVRSTGYDGERVEIGLSSNGLLLDRKVLTLEKGTREYPISLFIVPEKDGTMKLTAEVSRLPGELTDANNRFSSFIKVLRSKMRILLLAGGPSQDVAFVRRALEADKNIEVKPFIGQKNGTYFGGQPTLQSLNDADCLVLVGYPDPSASLSTLSLVREALATSKPFLFILSRTIDIQKLRTLEQFLPFTVGEVTQNEYQTFVAIPESKRNHPILKLTTGSSESWAKLSPLFRIQAHFRSKPESEVLGTSRIQSVVSSDPILLSRSLNRSKSFAVLGYGLWHWKMFSEPGSGAEMVLEEFLANTIRWLTTRDDDRRVKVQPVKPAFNGQEPVEFVGQVYDESYKPIDDAVVQVMVTHRKQPSAITLASFGSGQYAGSVDRLDEGDYTFSAKAELAGKSIGEDKGTFSVGSLNVEFLDTRMNKHLLEQLADRTGGRYHASDALENIASEIAALPGFKPHEMTLSKDIELWNSKWMLGVIVLFLGIEWLLRKRSGML
jgi:hypothetical protein